jgi:hypothetical protein
VVAEGHRIAGIEQEVLVLTDCEGAVLLGLEYLKLGIGHEATAQNRDGSLFYQLAGNNPLPSMPDARTSTRGSSHEHASLLSVLAPAQMPVVEEVKHRDGSSRRSLYDGCSPRHCRWVSGSQRLLR